MRIEPIEIADTSEAIPVTAAFAFAEGSYPEGGVEAWIQVFAASIVFFFFLGILYSFGLYQDVYLQEGLANSAVLGLLGSLGPTLEVSLAVPSAWISGRIGIKATAAVGSVAVGLGLFLASFCTHSVSLPLWSYPISLFHGDKCS